MSDAIKIRPVVIRPIASIRRDPNNAKQHSDAQLQLIAHSIRTKGMNDAVKIIATPGEETEWQLIAGEGRWRACGEILGMVDIPTVDVTDLSEKDRLEYALADNRIAELATWNASVLQVNAARLEDMAAGSLAFAGFSAADLSALTEGPKPPKTGAGSLVERFGVPPFTVLNAREGWWQDRKRAWIALGIESELGRGDSAGSKLTMSDTIQREKPSADQAAKRAANRASPGRSAMPAANYSNGARGNGRGQAIGNAEGMATYGAVNFESGAPVSGTSIFDPVMCELAYRWFCPPAGLILDPFAGGSVRGIVAAKLERHYVGVDLRAEQIAANEAQADAMGLTCDQPFAPYWQQGDSADVVANDLTLVQGSGSADFVFTCPPYGDLERYSDDPADLSAMDHAEFLKAYRVIIAAAVARLRADRFAAVVVGDFRDKAGMYRNFVSDTIAAFEAAGARLYNEAILVTAVGSLPIRAAKQFEKSRKLGKTHQNFLVFCKGDPVKATEAIGAVEFGELEAEAVPEIGGEVD